MHMNVVAVQGCATESRNLVNRGTESVGRNVDLDKLDRCSEVTLGLLTTVCVSLGIFVVAIPFFDIAGMSWIKSWEGLRGPKPAGQGPLPPRQGPPISLKEFKQTMGNFSRTEAGAFKQLDGNKDRYLDFDEFAEGTKRFKPPLDQEQAKYAYTGLDLDCDGAVGLLEFRHALGGDEFVHHCQPVAPTTTSTSTAAPTTTLAAAPTSTASEEKEREKEREKEKDNDKTKAAPEFVTRTSTTTRIASTETSTVTSTETSTGTSTETSTETSTSTTLPPTTTKKEVFVFGTTINAAVTSEKTSTTTLHSGPVTMAEFIARLGSAVRDSPHDAFSSLGRGSGNVLQLDEFVRATQRFERPLSVMQAEDVFAKLDTNRDSTVQSGEFFSAYTAKHFLAPVHGTAEPPLTIEEYHTRMAQATQIAAVLVSISSIDFDGLTDNAKRKVQEIFVCRFSDAAGVHRSAVKDLFGHPAAVTLSAGNAMGQGRRLSSGGLVIKVHIDVPSSEVTDDIIAVVTSGPTRKKIAQDLSGMSQVGAIGETAIQMSAWKQNSDAFMAIDKDRDGVLDIREFRGAGRQFKPPLSRVEVNYAFSGLDTDKDYRLSALEYEGYGLKHFFERPETKLRRMLEARPEVASRSSRAGLER